MVLFPPIKFIQFQTLVIKLIKVAIMNWVCNNVTTVYMLYIDNITSIFCSVIILLHGPKLLFPFSQIEYQIMDKKKKKKKVLS